jgi:hypothetical protein
VSILSIADLEDHEASNKVRHRDKGFRPESRVIDAMTAGQINRDKKREVANPKRRQNPPLQPNNHSIL